MKVASPAPRPGKSGSVPERADAGSGHRSFEATLHEVASTLAVSAAGRRSDRVDAVLFYLIILSIPLLVLAMLIAGLAWMAAMLFNANPLLVAASLIALLISTAIALRVSGNLERRAKRRGSSREPRWIADYEDLPGQRYREHYEAMPPWSKSVPAEVPVAWVTLAPLRVVIYEKGPGMPSLQVWLGDPDSWTLAAGTRLILTKSFNPTMDDRCLELRDDPSSWYQYCEGWESLTFEIVGGEHQGFAVHTCANPQGGRFPAAAQAAGALIAPVDHPLSTDAAARANHLRMLAASGVEEAPLNSTD